MAIDLKPSNEYARVELISIVFLQGDDYTTMEQELTPIEDDENTDPLLLGFNWIEDNEIIDYLLQWYCDNDNQYSSDIYQAEDINTPFLGDLIKIEGYKGYFLYSYNPSIGYAGLSKITRIIK